MVSPGVVAGAAPGVCLAVYCADRAVFLATREGLGRHLEGDALACLPEAGCKIVRKQQRVVSPLQAQSFDRLAGRLPRQPKFADIPLAELEAVGSGLCDE